MGRVFFHYCRTGKEGKHGLSSAGWSLTFPSVAEGSVLGAKGTKGDAWFGSSLVWVVLCGYSCSKGCC